LMAQSSCLLMKWSRLFVPSKEIVETKAIWS